MYKLFMVCPNGHVMQIGCGTHYADNALNECAYQAKHCGLAGVRFEVWCSGSLVREMICL